MAQRTTKTTAETLEFVGPPRRLVAVGSIPDFDGTEEVTGALAKYLATGQQPLRLRRGTRRGASLRLQLNPATPPGDYSGTLTSGKKTLNVAARVLPDTRVTVLAGDLDFSAALGATATATLAMANMGNTEIQLPRAIPIGLFDDDGLETAFAASYAKPLKTVDAFFETFHGKLSEAHSGLLKLAIKRGFGTHAPGTSFSAEFALNIDKPLRPGRRYHGVASLDFADLSITVSVINGVTS